MLISQNNDEEGVILGFTGTQRGLSLFQREMLKELLLTQLVRMFHHGDCLGADNDAHKIVRDNLPKVLITIHPPNNPYKRAFCDADVLRPAFPYLVRNKNIVDSCNVLIACPGEHTEQLRSGTWSTIRYARKMAKNMIIILPSGEPTKNLH